jgi:prevent-host-death family protein
MDKISATELNKHPGHVLQMAQRKPVIIEKTGQPAAVIMSYEYFTELEDYYFGNLAKTIEETAEYLSNEESEIFLKNV